MEIKVKPKTINKQQYMKNREKTPKWLIDRNHQINNSNENFDVELEKECKNLNKN